MQRHISLKIKSPLKFLSSLEKTVSLFVKAVKKKPLFMIPVKLHGKFESVPVLKYQVFFFIPEGGFNVLPVV